MDCVLPLPLPVSLTVMANWSQHILIWISYSSAYYLRQPVKLIKVGALNETYLLSLV